MERVMSVEDKIRRAEEIYYKRREQENPRLRSGYERNKERKFGYSIKLLKKMITQIIICLIIYAVFYSVVSNDYVFSKDFTNKAKEIINQDINFAEIYQTISCKIQDIHNRINSNVENTTQEETQKQNEEITETTDSQESNEKVEENIVDESNNNSENIGGSEEELTGDNKVELSQMEQDANYIKSNISFIKPISGTISSSFGFRNPTTETVPKNHTGTDIAAKTGTKILSATAGNVILASSTGDYGKHLKIQTSDNDVVVVYAHCNSLYVNEGDFIKQGQEIAEVGATGNVTGPHLHFEVRYQNRYVNPELILEL